MDSTVLVWVLIGIALIAANTPWFSDKLFLFKVVKGGKGFFLRLLEWLVLYVVVGAAAMGLETKLNGVRHEQGWEFYVVTFFLFMVFALPGVIYHIDLKHHLRIKTQ